MTPEASSERREWLIWNADYHQFWGPNSGGYFGLWGAGLYTESEARRLSSNRDRRDQAHHITEYRDQISNMRGAFERLNDTLKRADEATSECDDHPPLHPDEHGDWAAANRGARRLAHS